MFFCVVNGTTGEGPSLTIEERKKIVEKWVEAGRGKYVLIIIAYTCVAPNMLCIIYSEL